MIFSLGLSKMMTARFFSGASLFALLIADICCLPTKKGFNPSASYAATNFGSNQGAPSGQFSPGVVPNYAPSNGVASPSYQAALRLEPTFSQPAVQRQPAASSGPVVSAYRANSVQVNPASSTQPGTSFQPAPRDLNWAVAPPSLLSGGEEGSAGSRGVDSSMPENVSPPLPPPGPVYQAGELSRYVESFEHGDSERETEEQGYLPPLVQQSAGQDFNSQPQQVPDVGGIWGPYPDYTFLFLTGQLPEGTLTHSSSSYEQGSDNWQDLHYERYYYPYNAGPAQQIETFTGDLSAPKSFEEPRQSVKSPVMAGYGQGGAQAGPPAASLGRFRQPTRSQAGGYYMSQGGH